MTIEREQKTAQAINTSLQQSAQKLQRLAEQGKDVSPATARKIEQRLEALQADIDNVSGPMLAYKLRRIADSKMLKQMSDAPAAAPAAKSKKATKSATAKSASAPDAYQSTTFQCKSDLDLCLVNSKNALDKALCYALFIRCAIKG